ncbi:hypothetical protein [Antarctobacter sp.]|uniref:hypothetical protein n=1 Tax=Antarctobacter sp. TaxID=1872577 RepID=UPI003A8DF30C
MRAGPRAPAPLPALALLWPSPALAGVCDTERPGWDGTPANAISEALFLASSLPAAALIVATALAVRLRSKWGGLAVVSGWSILISLRVFDTDPTGIRQMATIEGCIGSPTLFIGLVTAICIATILYTAPMDRRTND